MRGMEGSRLFHQLSRENKNGIWRKHGGMEGLKNLDPLNVSYMLPVSDVSKSPQMGPSIENPKHSRWMPSPSMGCPQILLK